MNRISCQIAGSLLLAAVSASAAEGPTRLPAPDAAQLAHTLAHDDAVVRELKLTTEQSDELGKAAHEKVFGLLTEKQRAAYDELVGEEFVFSKHETQQARSDARP